MNRRLKYPISVAFTAVAKCAAVGENVLILPNASSVHLEGDGPRRTHALWLPPREDEARHRADGEVLSQGDSEGRTVFFGLLFVCRCNFPASEIPSKYKVKKHTNTEDGICMMIPICISCRVCTLRAPDQKTRALAHIFFK